MVQTQMKILFTISRSYIWFVHVEGILIVLRVM